MTSPKIVADTVIESAKLGTKAGDCVDRAATGRIVNCLTDAQKEENELIRAWFSCTPDEFRSHPAMGIVGSAVKNAPPAQESAPLFRGRWFSVETPPKDGFCFGPPKKEDAIANRYNKDVPMLYLASTPCGVEVELAGRCGDGKVIYYHPYNIDFAALRIADLSSGSLPNIVHQTFDYCEFTDDYRPSQLLAEIVRSYGYDGMRIPGVRGSRENRYFNVVVFEPTDAWRSWVDSTATPQRIERMPKK